MTRNPTVRLIECSYERHADAILAILNDVIATSTALFDYAPRPRESMAGWFDAKVSAGFPVVGAVEDDTLLGFATYGVFRAWPAYKYSVEHSVYVDRAQRGKGIGFELMKALTKRARSGGYHTMIGGIESTNTSSIALHRKLGFEHAGTIRQAGFKFGRWLDVELYQLLLETPARPIEG